MFIVFEGPDGSGKSTQVNLLKEYLESQGKKVFVRREPGGTYFGEKARELLLQDPESKNMCFQSQVYLVLLSYSEGLREVKRRLEEGFIVIQDRISEISSLIYQGDMTFEGGVKTKLIDQYHKDAKEIGRLPDFDLMFCLLPSLENSIKRITTVDKQTDYLDQVGENFKKRYSSYQRLFKKLSSKYPNKYKTVNADGNPNEIFEEILDLLPQK